MTGKRGIKSVSKRKTVEPIRPRLPPDILREVASFLPAYCFVGSRTIRSVSKVFNTPELTRVELISDKKTVKALIYSCKTPLDALNILTDQIIFNNLSFYDCLQVTSHHPGIVYDLLDDPIIVNKLPYGGVATLGLADEQIALHIVSTPSLQRKVTLLKLEQLGLAFESIAKKILEDNWNDFNVFDVIGNLAYQHPNIAHAILDDAQYVPIYHESPIKFIGEKHWAVVKKILESPHLYHHLSGSDLGTISKAYPTLIPKIFNTPALREKLDKDEFLELGRNEAVAFLMLNTPELCETLHSLGLFKLCSFHLSVVVHILNTPHLLAKLGLDPFGCIGTEHLSIGLEGLNKLELCNKLSSTDLAWLGEAHKEIADKILNTPSLCNQLTGDNLRRLGHNQNPCIAHQIFKSPELSKKLSNEDWAFLGETHETIAQVILSDQNLCNILNGDDLVKLGKHPRIAKSILASPRFYTKLGSLDVLNLCHDKASAMMILNTPMLCEKLKDYSLTELGKRYSSVALQILRTPYLCNMLPGSLLAAMGKNSYQVAIEILSKPSLCHKLSDNNMFSLINNRLGVYHVMKNMPLYRDRRFPENILDIKSFDDCCAIYFKIQQKAVALRNKETSFAHQCPYHLRKRTNAR